MKQVIQNFKTGKLYVDDVPMPALQPGMILVENVCSLISAGTERSTVKVAQANLLGKAKQRPELVAQVLQNIKKEGLKATLEKVKTKLDSLKALGYSSAGTVLASMDHNNSFKPGDRIACAGQDFASHSEIVCIPQNLAAKIPDNVTFEEASFTTLGAIALQGIRQADPKLGEYVCIIGLGLIGQLTAQMLKANGCKVLGIDLSDKLLNLAIENGIDMAARRDDEDLISKINNFTNGYGFDSVIITAATSSNDPIELSAEITRKKAKVVIVGAVKMDVPRDPHFYRKELSLLMSCSYGPGRYDQEYETHGHDYPYGYVRWTQQRNMEAFLQLIAQKRINIAPLITHRFTIENAMEAYDIVMGKKQEHHIGILLQYAPNTTKFQQEIKTTQPVHKNINVGFIGAGSFAQSYLLPHLKADNISLHSVITSKGITAKNVCDKFGFHAAGSDASLVLNNKEINTVFIATPHNSHGQLVLEAIKNGKNVFVEKPLTIYEEELETIKNEAETSSAKLMVGFNRRFSPAAKQAFEAFRDTSEPLLINYRINAGFLPKEHWAQDDRIGGGRIIGEVCHFIDLLQFLTQSTPKIVFASCITSENATKKNNDNVAINVTMQNGSIANILYCANGNKLLPKEHIEIFGEGKSVIIDDFKEVTVYAGNKARKHKTAGKGHKEEVVQFISSIEKGEASPIAFSSIYLTTLSCFKIMDSLVTGMPQNVA